MNFFSSESAAVCTSPAVRSAASTVRRAASWLRTSSIWLISPTVAVKSFWRSRSTESCVPISASLPPEFGSLRTTSGCVNSWPPTDSFTV